MKKILDEYRFVKLTRKWTYRQEKEANIGIQSTGYLAVHPSTAFVKQKYLKRHWTSNPSKLQRICRNAIKDGYLEGVDIPLDNNAKIDGLCITDKGDELLDRALWVIPIGLWVTWWDKFGVFISGLVLGVLVPASIALAKWILQQL